MLKHDMKLPSLIIFLILGCVPLHAQELTLLYTNNYNGIIESCDCPGNELGGIAFVSVAIAPYRYHDPNRIFVDGGDYLPMKDLPPKADYMLKFLKALDYDAINLGDQDFWLGADYLIQNARELNLPLINATIVRDSTLVFKPYIIKTTSLGEAAVIGYMGQQIFNLIDPANRQGLLCDEERHFVGLLDKFREEGKILIVLNHAGLGECNKMAQRFPFIDIIVAAHDQERQTTPPAGQPPFILEAGRNSEFLGVAKLRKTAGQWEALQDFSLPVLPIRDHRSALMDSLVAAYELASKNFLEKLEIRKKQTRAKLNRNSACAGCHYDMVTQFNLTSHSRSYNALSTAQKAGDPDCLRCHTTFFGQNGGFISLTATPEFRDLSCISCHTHLAQADLKHHASKAIPRTRVAEQVCRSCHTSEWSPHFDFKKYRPYVLHDLKTYTVKQNDTMTEIARSFYGNPKYYKLIAEANKLDDAKPELIFIDQKLIIPKIPPSVQRCAN